MDLQINAQHYVDSCHGAQESTVKLFYQFILFPPTGDGDSVDLPPMSLPSHTELNLDKSNGGAQTVPVPAQATTSTEQQQQDPQQQQELTTKIAPRILLLEMSPSNMSFEVEMQDTSATNIE